MKNREDIKKVILEFENEYPVNEWMYNEIHIWPYIRIKLFFYLFSVIESVKPSSLDRVSSFKVSSNLIKNTIKSRLLRNINHKISRIKGVFRYLNWYWKLPLKSNLFLGNDSHRVNFKNKRFNRYFDTLIENQKIQNDSMYFEYDELSNDYIYNRNIVFRFNKAIEGFITLNKFRNKKKIINLKGYDKFLFDLNQMELTKRITKKISEEKLISWFDDFWLRVLFFKKVLGKIKPKRVYILCYYSNADTFAFVCAANQLKIKTIEIQHGPQTDIHLCYGSWYSIPKNGYDLLPRNFYCWDETSKETMLKWTSKSDIYSSVKFGNPWVEYWKNIEVKYDFSDYVLYSLQCNLKIEKQFSPNLIKLIKEGNRKWFIRLHPRQLDEQNLIFDYLVENKIEEKINIYDATNDPLPLLLSNAFIHVTHSSGSAIEASFFGLKTILISELGKQSFPRLLEDGQAEFVDYLDEDFCFKMNKLFN